MASLWRSTINLMLIRRKEDGVGAAPDSTAATAVPPLKQRLKRSTVVGLVILGTLSIFGWIQFKKAMEPETSEKTFLVRAISNIVNEGDLRDIAFVEKQFLVQLKPSAYSSTDKRFNIFTYFPSDYNKDPDGCVSPDRGGKVSGCPDAVLIITVHSNEYCPYLDKMQDLFPGTRRARSEKFVNYLEAPASPLPDDVVYDFDEFPDANHDFRLKFTYRYVSSNKVICADIRLFQYKS